MGFAEFNISSSGIGDIGLTDSKIIAQWEAQELSYSVGVSLPTGSINQKGDWLSICS